MYRRKDENIKSTAKSTFELWDVPKEVDDRLWIVSLDTTEVELSKTGECFVTEEKKEEEGETGAGSSYQFCTRRSLTDVI